MQNIAFKSIVIERLLCFIESNLDYPRKALQLKAQRCHVDRLVQQRKLQKHRIRWNQVHIHEQIWFFFLQQTTFSKLSILAYRIIQHLAFMLFVTLNLLCSISYMLLYTIYEL